MKIISFTNSLIEIDVAPVQAEEDSCRIEYVISDESFQKLKEAYKKEMIEHTN